MKWKIKGITMYNLQKRWALEGTILRYYGLRNRPNMFKNTVKLTKTQKAIIEKLPCELTSEEISGLKNLIGSQVVKDEDLTLEQKILLSRLCDIQTQRLENENEKNLDKIIKYKKKINI